MTCQHICRLYTPMVGQASGPDSSAFPVAATVTPKSLASLKATRPHRQFNGLECGNKPQAHPTRNSQVQRCRLTLDRAVLANRGLM
jgi:hypothetical protein